MPKMYELLHCPFCGSTEISDRKENFNFRADFWACLFIYIWGVLLAAFAGSKRFVDAMIAEMNSLSMNEINIFCHEKNNRILCPVGRAFVISLV